LAGLIIPALIFVCPEFNSDHPRSRAGIAFRESLIFLICCRNFSVWRFFGGGYNLTLSNRGHGVRISSSILSNFS